MRLTLYLWLASGAIAFAQDWQATYQASVDAYKKENFIEAIARAETALTLSQSLDQKARAYSLQIFTAACLEGNKTEGVLDASTQEIELFSSLEPNGKNYREALRKKGKLFLLIDMPLDAARLFHELATNLQSEKNGESLYYYQVLADEADAYVQAGKLPEAKALYLECLPAFATNEEAGEDFFYTLFNAAAIEYQLKENAAASKHLEQFIEMAKANQVTDIPEYEQARKMLSSINSQQGGSGGSVFLVPEDQLKKLLKDALEAQQAQVDEATSIYDSASNLIVENSLVNNTSFSVYVNFARFLYALGKFDPAQARLKDARTIATKLFQPKSREIVTVDILEADLLIEAGKKTAASDLYKASLNTILLEPPDIAARQVRWMAEQLLKAGLPADSEFLLNHTFNSPVYDQISSDEKILLEKLLLNAAIDQRQVERATARLKDLSSKEPNPALKQGYLLLYAQAEKENGNYTQALSLLQQSAALVGDGSLEGEMHLELGRIHQQLGNYKEAELAFSKAVEKSPNARQANILRPQVYNSFATFYIQMGNYAAAEKLFLKLLREDKKQSLFHNAVRQNFAAMYQQMGRYAEAKTLLLQTVAADLQLFGADHPDYGIALQNLAAVYQKMARPDSAFLLLEQALQIDKKYYGNESLQYAAKVANLGALYQDQKDFAKALKCYNEALAIRTQKLHAEHPDYNYNLYTIGYLLYRTHQLEKALPYFRESGAFYLRQIRDVFPVLSDYERNAFYNRLQEVIQGYQMFMTEYSAVNPAVIGDLLNFRLETKALLLNASLKVRNQILMSKDQQLISKFAVWQHTKEQLAYLYSLTAEEQKEHVALIAEYKDKGNELEKWLSQKSEAFAFAVNLPVGNWKHIQERLKPGEAAVEIVRTALPNDSVVYAAIVLRPASAQPQMVVLNDGKSLENKVFKIYINSIRFQLEDRLSYEKFWKKIDGELKGASVVYLSGDGVYNKINPLTFYIPETKQYVLDQYKIELASNLKDIVTNSQHATGGRTTKQSALLMGFPDYRLDTKLQATDIKAKDAASNLFFQLIKAGVSDLLGTLSEINEVKSSLESSQWRVMSYLREAATEEALKSSRNPTLLHIATHGFFITSTKKNAVQVHGNDIDNIDNNVMLRSGVLLAGAEKNLLERISGVRKNDSDDGVLTAFEIMNMNLDSTELVVLSACETGIGDIRNGEGVYGLQRAFLLAGADAVIMSLWKVDDEATSLLMTKFYQQWTSGVIRSEAFYAAQKELRTRMPHPYFWGAFVVTGDL